MSDPWVRMLLWLFPEEFRGRMEPQIEADMYHPRAHPTIAVLRAVRAAIICRLLSPEPYVWLTAVVIAGVVIGASLPLFATLAVRALPASVDHTYGMWAVLFFGVLTAVLGTMLGAIHWLHMYRKMREPRCLQSRT